MNELDRISSPTFGAGHCSQYFLARVKTSQRDGNSDEPTGSIRVLLKHQDAKARRLRETGEVVKTTWAVEICPLQQAQRVPQLPRDSHHSRGITPLAGRLLITYQGIAAFMVGRAFAQAVR